MTEPHPPSHQPEQPNPWARPPEGMPEQPMPYGPSYPPPPTTNWAYDPQQQPPTAPPPQQRSVKPILAVIVVAVVLLCAGTVVAGVLVVNQARNAAQDILPSLPPLPTAAPEPTRPAPTGSAPETEDPFQIPGLPDLDDLLPTGAGITASPDATVVYEVTGPDDAAVTYTEAGTTPKSERDVRLPWRKEFTLGSETPLLSVTGIHFGTDNSELTCRITLDGKEIVKRTASGNATTATCMQFVMVS
ncbi:MULTISPECIES: MmpS family transport accessory protein [Catenuloplanes]|uniref:MmpS family membrane protein n=1 Tax=Catenuloplanes niger TaxID=587534 RepID=A0AAE4CSZ0_9ACTN|nr:MmpS family transport accessory protein [Catenuloplanes niger]MDR7322842.1 hypothetical protein [Catenuloplanes niger]